MDGAFLISPQVEPELPFDPPLVLINEKEHIEFV
jgi:hypothetical protein